MKIKPFLIVAFSMMLATLPITVHAAESLKVAVVALSVNDYGGYLKSSGNPQTDQLIQQNLNSLLEETENLLEEYWQVIPLDSFIKNQAYIATTVGHLKSGLFAPVVNGVTVPSFTDDRKSIVKCVMTADQAKNVCAATGADVVVNIYSEWAVKTGSFVPTNKALAKNCMSMYSKDGKQLFYGRKDVMGTRTLGAMGSFAMNEETIKEWAVSYTSGIQQVISKNAAKVR